MGTSLDTSRARRLVKMLKRLIAQEHLYSDEQLKDMKKFIFDVDVTLTESRKQMDISFMSEFIKFECKFDTYLVTGSDRDKTVEQVGLRQQRIYYCSNARCLLVYRNPTSLIIFLSKGKLPSEIIRYPL